MRQYSSRPDASTKPPYVPTARVPARQSLPVTYEYNASRISTHVRNKKIASFDAKVLFTNVNVDGTMVTMGKVVSGMTPDSLPVPKADFLKLVRLCLEFGAFTFHGVEISDACAGWLVEVGHAYGY